MFYTMVDGKFIKTISYDILTILTPEALAVWAMDDGAATTSGSGFYLHTKGFTFVDVYKLVAILHYNFGLVCTVQNHKGCPVIYITSQSINAFRTLVTPYFVPCMIYKLQ